MDIQDHSALIEYVNQEIQSISQTRRVQFCVFRINLQPIVSISTPNGTIRRRAEDLIFYELERLHYIGFNFSVGEYVWIVLIPLHLSI